MEEIPKKNAITIMPGKTVMPKLSRGHVRRTNLLDDIDLTCQEQRLTLLHAPAGYGKTSLMADLGAFRLERGDKIVWVEVDEYIAGRSAFWLHVWSALLGVDSAREAALSVCQDELPVQLSSRLYDLDPESLGLLFVDGFDRIGSDDTRAEFLMFCSLLPPDLHVVVSARTLSDSIMAASYRLGELAYTIEELSFSVSEVEEVLGLRGDEVVCKQVVARVYDKTEGWPKGVRLAARVISRGEDVSCGLAFDGSSRLVKDYFHGQVLAGLSDELRSFLTQLSLFERFNANLIGYAFEDEKCEALLDEAISLNAFVLGGEDGGGWSRLHPLLADALSTDLDQTKLERVRWRCLLASEWFHENRLRNEAAKYLIMSIDTEYVESLVEGIFGLTRPAGEASSLLWMSRVRASEFDDSPLLCALSVWTDITTARLADAGMWEKRLEKAIQEKREGFAFPPECVDFANKCTKMKRCAMSGRGREALALCEELLDGRWLVKPALRSMIYQSEAEAYEHMGNYDQAMELHLKAQASSSVDETRHQDFFNAYTYATILYYRGDHAEARECCEAILRRCPEDYSIYGAACALLARIKIECDDRGQVSDLLERAQRRVSCYCHVDLYLEMKMAQSSYLFSLGRESDAYETIVEAVLHGEQYESIPRQVLLLAYFLQAEIALTQGNERELKIIEQKIAPCAHEDDYLGQLFLAQVQAYLLKLEGRGGGMCRKA